MTSLQLAYEEYGSDTSEPLILIHGFFASSRNWRQMAKNLANDFHVYSLDMRNHGLSPHHPEMDYPSMANDLVVFMDEHKIPVTHLLGHSMGGKVAMWFALNHPDRINKLIIADISPVTYQHSFDNTINALMQIPLDQVANRKQADDYLAPFIDEHSYRQFLLQNLQLIEGQYSWRVDLEIFKKTASLIIGFPEKQPLPAYSDSALFLMGENPLYTNKPAILEHFPQADITVLKGANHWLHVDKPDEFLALAVSFIK